MNKIWIIGISATILANFILALGLVWTNTQRTALAYELKKQQQVLTDLTSYSAKLGVERDRLLSPYYLDRKADELGLGSARPGQKRFMN